MIISQVTNHSLFVGMDVVQAKMLTELLRRATPSSCKEAAAEVAKAGFDYVGESDVQAMASSAAFSLGRLTDQFVGLKNAIASEVLAGFEAEKDKEGNPIVN